MKCTKILLETLRRPFRPELLKEAKVPSDISKWRAQQLKHFRITFEPAQPTTVCPGFNVNSPLLERAQTLLQPVKSNPLLTSVTEWIDAMRPDPDDFAEGGEFESSVDHFAGEILHAAKLHGDGYWLLPQRKVSADIGDVKAVAIPDFVVRDAQRVVVVIHDCKRAEVKLPGGHLPWGQLGGELLVAALRNINLLQYEPDTMSLWAVSARTTRFTFFRADFTKAYLLRADRGAVDEADAVTVHTWGGRHVELDREADGVAWRLDFNKIDERRELLQMLSAISACMRAPAAGQGGTAGGLASR